MKKIIIISGKHKKYERNFLFLKILKKNYHIIEYEFEGNFFIKNLKALKLLFLKYDLVLINWPYWSSFFIINLINLIKQKPILYDFFTLMEEDYSDNNTSNKNLFLSSLYLIIQNYIIRFSNGLITDTETHKKEILKTKLKQNNQILSFQISQMSKNSKKKNINKNKINLLHSSANRNMHKAIKIVYLVKNLPKKIKKKLRFKIILKDHKDKIKNSIKKYNLGDNIKIINRVEKKKFFEIVKNTDVCLGIFGNSKKSKNVISNFIVTSCNYSKILITKKTPASLHYLINNPNIFLLDKIDDKSFLHVIKKIINLKKISSNKIETKTIFNKYFDINKNSTKLISFLNQFLHPNN